MKPISHVILSLLVIAPFSATLSFAFEGHGAGNIIQGQLTQTNQQQQQQQQKSACPYDNVFEGATPAGYPCNQFYTSEVILTSEVPSRKLLGAEKTIELFPGDLVETGVYLNQSNGSPNFWSVKVACENSESTQYGATRLHHNETLVINGGRVRARCHNVKPKEVVLNDGEMYATGLLLNPFGLDQTEIVIQCQAAVQRAQYQQCQQGEGVSCGIIAVGPNTPWSLDPSVLRDKIPTITCK